MLLFHPGALLLVPTMMVLFGIVGGFQATTPEQAAQIQQIIADRLEAMRPEESAARRVAAALTETGAFRGEVRPIDEVRQADADADYRGLAARGFGVALEVRIPRLSFSMARGSDPLLALIVTVDGRLIDVETGRVIASRHASYQSPRRKSTEWAQNDGQLLFAEVDRAYSVLGDRLVEVLLLGAEWTPTPSWETIAAKFSACGLQPKQPVPNWVLFGSTGVADTVVDSRFPMLAWEQFPPKQWVSYEPSLSEAKAITYDVRVWRDAEHLAGDLVYERIGLAATSHRVEHELEPATRYLWSVRARYNVAGRPRATRWTVTPTPYFFPAAELAAAVSAPRIEAGSVVAAAPCARGGQERWTPCKCLDFIPSANLFRFRTP
ncbi:MAG: hypothetical protein IPM30_00925 [Burkholderiales bacterium]|jgi:hypothetical protein|nr:hypothetical protein [Burkholderiales bacterium]